MAKEKIHVWENKPILSQDDIPDLEHAAALLEFEHGYPREQAQHLAHKMYSDKIHTEAAAHHLLGLKAAQQAGDLDECHRHGVAYKMHMDKLGLDSMDKTPESVSKLMAGLEKPKVYRFKAHKADRLLSPIVEP